MKNSLFLLIFLTILSIQVSAQKTLPPALQPYVQHLDFKIVKSLHSMGFEMPAMPEQRPQKTGVQARSADLQLDSTIQFYGYTVPDANDSLPLVRTRYEYLQPNVKAEINDYFENGAWAPNNRSIHISDALGRIVEAEAEVFDPAAQGYRPDSRVVAYPHEDSPDLLDSFFVWQWDVNTLEWYLLVFNRNVFDDQDRVIENYASFDLFGQPLVFKDVYYYDANGDNTLVETFGLIDGLEYPAGKRTIQYVNHLPVELISFVINDVGEYGLDSRITYTYVDFGKEEQVDSFVWSTADNDWVLNQSVIYTYDDEQRISSKMTIFIEQDGSETRDVIDYYYKQDELLALEEVFFRNAEGLYTLSDRKYYYYSEQTSAVEEPAAAPLLAMPNPTTGFVQLGLSEPALIRIYNTQGELVSSGEYRPDFLLNITDLPGGLYFITARTTSERFSGRVVKQ
jgi:hypothetical protein